MGEFRREYPEITLELTSNDRIVDLMEHRTDIAIRMGPLTDSTLHARPLRPAPRWMMASPEYIAARGAGDGGGSGRARGVGLHAPRKPERVAAQARRRVQLSGDTDAGHIQRGNAAAAGAARCGNRVPVGFRRARGHRGRAARQGDGGCVQRLPATHARGVPPQYAAVTAHCVLFGFLRRTGVGGMGCGAQPIMPRYACNARPNADNTDSCSVSDKVGCANTVCIRSSSVASSDAATP
ncbi:transcriptional regulator [Achromobacter marplatensis]|nr:transcriptional regulator [Achromobacter marplatensis]